MARLTHVVAALCAVASGACRSEPPELSARAPVIRVSPADTLAARRMAERVYWNSGFWPDTITLRSNVLLVHMPPGSLGERLRIRGNACDAGNAPYGIVRTVARRAFRDFGSTHGVSMVVVTIPGMSVERRSMFERGSMVNSLGCSLGGSVTQFSAHELQDGDEDASGPPGRGGASNGGSSCAAQKQERASHRS